jgi:hypothetical protein
MVVLMAMRLVFLGAAMTSNVKGAAARVALAARGSTTVMPAYATTPPDTLHTLRTRRDDCLPCTSLFRLSPFEHTQTVLLSHTLRFLCLLIRLHVVPRLHRTIVTPTFSPPCSGHWCSAVPSLSLIEYPTSA